MQQQRTHTVKNQKNNQDKDKGEKTKQYPKQQKIHLFLLLMSNTVAYLSHEGIAVAAGLVNYIHSATFNKAAMHSFECWQMVARGNCWTSGPFWASLPKYYVVPPAIERSFRPKQS